MLVTPLFIKGFMPDNLGVLMAFSLIADIIFAILFFGCLIYGIIFDEIKGNAILMMIFTILSPFIFIATTYIIDLIYNISVNYNSGMSSKACKHRSKCSIISAKGKIDPFKQFNMGIKGLGGTYYTLKIYIASVLRRKSYQISVILWNIGMVILWYLTLPYLKRSRIDEMWSFSEIPDYLYIFQCAFISVASTEAYFETIGKEEFINIFTASFVIDFLTLPPFLLLIKFIFLKKLNILQIYWLLGFLKLIKLLFKLKHYYINVWISVFNETSKFILNLFLIFSSYAGSLFIFQGISESQLSDGNRYLNAFYEICDFYYFSVVTVSTVGYGDVLPLTKYAKIATVLFISWIFIYIPVAIHRLLSIINHDSTHFGSFPTKFGKTRFILIIGDISITQLNLFIYSMFTSNCNKKLVVLTSRRIEEFSESIKLANELRVIISIVKGDIGIKCSLHDLTKLRVENASSIILVNNFNNTDTLDLSTIGRAISLVKYSCNPEIMTMQLFKDVTKSFLNFPIQKVCLNQIKVMLFLKSLSCPGIIPLLSILSSPHLSSNRAIQFTGAFAELPNSSQEEYLSGLKGRLFSLKIPPGKVGMPFSEVALQINTLTDLIIIGVQNRKDHYFILNPLDYKIKEDDCIISAARSDDLFNLEGVHPDDSKLDMAPRKTLLNIALNSAISEFNTIQSSPKFSQYDDIETESTLLSIRSLSDESKELETHVSRASNELTVSSVEEAFKKFSNPKLPLLITFGDISKLENFLPLIKYSGKFNVISIFKQPLGYDCYDIMEFSDLLCLIDADALLDSIWDKINLQPSYHYIILPQSGGSEYEIDMVSVIIHRKLLKILSTNGNKLIQGNTTPLNWVVLTELANPVHSALLSDSKWKLFDNSILSTPQLYSSDYARGSVFFNDLLYNLVTHNYSINIKSVYPQVFLQLSKCATSKDPWDGIQLLSISEISKEATYLPCPTFNILYKHLLKTKKLVSIAIYRRGENMFDRYILPVPCPKTKIRASDQIFVIPNGSIIHV